MNVLSINGLSIAFHLPTGRTQAVSNVSFDVPAGQTTALVGESGSGKSTIGNAVMGLLPNNADIDRGEILLRKSGAHGARTDLAKLPRTGGEFRSLRGQRISMIFQEPMSALSPVHTIGDQISEVVYLHEDVSRDGALKKACHMLDRVGFPDAKSACRLYPFELSGGLRQRAMIAMAMVCQPDLLIADEPTTALDVTVQAQILHTLAELKSELGMGVLLITHDLGVVSQIADRVVVLHRGEVMEAGDCAAILKAPGHPYLKGLLEAVPSVGRKPSERLEPLAKTSKTVTGRFFDTAGRSSGGRDKKTPLIHIRNASKTYHARSDGMFESTEENRTLALDRVSLVLNQGECLGLVGESGSGKTTLCRALMRAIALDSGEIGYYRDGTPQSVLGLESADLKAYRRRVQYVFQDPFSSLNPRMNVCDIIREPLDIHKLCPKKEQIERVAELLSLVGLNPNCMNRYPHAFSGGQRQRIGIARALALQPEILILDEPVSSLDVSVQAQVLNLMKDLKEQLGLTYLFISHNLGVVQYMADRVAVMVAGRIAEIATVETLFDDPRHPYSRALLNAVPSVDPDQKSDFAALAANPNNAPDLWPAPFTGFGGDRGDLIETTANHFVAMAKGHA